MKSYRIRTAQRSEGAEVRFTIELNDYTMYEHIRISMSKEQWEKFIVDCICPTLEPAMDVEVKFQ